MSDYYSLLSIDHSATQAQVTSAYRKASLLTHPDRLDPTLPNLEQRRKEANERFSSVADAYFTLSDPTRRAAYDQKLKHAQPPPAGMDGRSYFDYFARAAGAGAQSRPEADHVFGDVFEEMLRPEIQRTLPLWTWAGGIGGGILGFIAGNLPGAAIGAYGGSRVGAVRDSKGKAVYEVFKDLGNDQKAEVLKGLMAKVFAGMAGRVS